MTVTSKIRDILKKHGGYPEVIFKVMILEGVFLCFFFPIFGPILNPRLLKIHSKNQICISNFQPLEVLWQVDILIVLSSCSKFPLPIFIKLTRSRWDGTELIEILSVLWSPKHTLYNKNLRKSASLSVIKYHLSDGDGWITSGILSNFCCVEGKWGCRENPGRGGDVACFEL